jgi:hypothetical protein
MAGIRRMRFRHGPTVTVVVDPSDRLRDYRLPMVRARELVEDGLLKFDPDTGVYSLRKPRGKRVY